MSIFIGLKLLSYIVSLCLTISRTAKHSTEVAPFCISSAMPKSSTFYLYSSQELFSLVSYSESNRSDMLSHYNFDIHLYSLAYTCFLFWRNWLIYLFSFIAQLLEWYLWIHCQPQCHENFPLFCEFYNFFSHSLIINVFWVKLCIRCNSEFQVICMWKST